MTEEVNNLLLERMKSLDNIRQDIEGKTFTAKGRIFKDYVGKRTWIEIETDDGLQLSVGFKGEARKLDRYFLKTEEFTDEGIL